MWNRQPTRYELIDPANTRLAHRQVQRWGLPDGWIISACPSHRALVSEEEFIAVQGIRAERGTGTAEGRRYLLAGLLRCGTCGRRMESCWANSRPAYRYGYSSASKPDHARLGNLYIREDDILPHLPGLLVRTEPAPRTRRRTRRGVDIRRPASEQAAVAGRLASLQLKCRADAWQPTGRFSLHPRALAA